MNPSNEFKEKVRKEKEGKESSGLSGGLRPRAMFEEVKAHAGSLLASLEEMPSGPAEGEDWGGAGCGSAGQRIEGGWEDWAGKSAASSGGEGQEQIGDNAEV